MQKKIYPQWRVLLTRISILQLLLLLTLPGIVAARESGVQNLMTYRVTISATNQQMEDVIRDIERQVPARFVFSPKLVRSHRRVSLSVDNQPLGYALDQLLTPLELKYRVSSNNLIVISRETQAKQAFVPTVEETTPLVSPAAEAKSAQMAAAEITGTVRSETGEGLPGVSILVKGTSIGTNTDLEGNYRLSIPDGMDATLVFSFVGYVTQELALGNRKVLDVDMVPDNKNLDEVVVVAYGTQRKESVVGAISTLSAKDLKVPVSKLSNALAGQLAGIVSVQGSGEPGAGSSFWIRGISSFGANNRPLILVDGIERSLDLVDPEDVESFSILKDATATAVYGVRGANGIVLITTRRGKYAEKPTINARFERGVLSPVRVPKLANAEQWMDYYNDISYDANGSIPFPDDVKQKYLSGEDPDLYPNVDWMKTIFKDATTSNRLNLNVAGGGKIARYYVAGSFYNENGIFNPAETKQYNPQVIYNKFSFRSNLDIDISPTTELSLNLANTYENKNRLGVNMATMYQIVMITPPISITPQYSDGTHAQPLVGSNPYYSLNSTGHSQDFWNTAQSLASLTQDLGFLTKGLKFNIKFSWDATNESTLDKRKNPATYYATGRDEEGNLILHKNADGSDYLSLARSNRGTKTTNLESSLVYDNLFGTAHRVGAMFLFSRREHINNFPGDYIAAFPYRNIGVAGRVTYGFNNKIFFESNFGYNGSENFAPGNRFGFFPSVALGYTISNENFFKNALPQVNLLKFRASHGYIGNDQIGGNRRFAYNSEMQTTTGYQFGRTGQRSLSGIATGHPGNPNVSWEEAIKTNIGFEFGMWDQLKLQMDYFHEKRDGIYILQQSVPSIVGVNVAQYVNLGKMENKGFDASLEYTYSKGDWLISGRGNFTYNRNRKLYDDKPTPIWAYQEEAGQAYLQQFGLVSLGLFESWRDIQESPVQRFGDVQPGDIKYKDINGDGVIDSYDRIAIGRTTIPEISYGFGLSMRYKSFDLSGFFQGVGNVTRIISGEPLVGPSGSILVNGQIFADVADKRWSLRNPDPNAEYPRMSLAYNENNRQASTYYQRDMSFIRLKNAEIGYTVPKSWTQKIGMSTGRIYIQGVNLLTFSKFKLWDPELDTSYGNIYPQMKVINFGVNLNF